MAVRAAYLAIIAIWSTTPLAIQWSGDGPGFLFGAAGRMVISLALLLPVVWLTRSAFPWNRAALAVYVTGGLSIYVAMTSLYWSAQHIPSGWISVIFGLSPVFTGVFAARWLDEPAFSEGRALGILLGVIGLGLVFCQGASMNEDTMLGVAGVLLGTLTHCVSAVWLKKLQPAIPALSVTAGGLVIATPLFVLSAVLGQPWPQEIPLRAMAAIIYLSIVGSAIGYTLYFHVLTRVSAGRMSLVTVITPITALFLGAVLNHEKLNGQIIAGTMCILTGLVCYEFGGTMLLWMRVRFGLALDKTVGSQES